METQRIKGMIDAARMCANHAINDLHCAMSWVGWTDKEEDERDPDLMMRESLAKAEANAEKALEVVRNIRALTNQPQT